MLQFQAKDFDIVRISKLLIKYNIEAAITDTQITLNGDISDDLLEEICKCVNINIFQNFKSEAISQKEEPIKETEVKEDMTNHSLISTFTKEYDLLYSTVKRGEVYMCDLGEPYKSEQGYLRPVIIVQNDSGNTNSTTTIVISCSSELNKHHLPVHHVFDFSKETLIDYDSTRYNFRKSIVLAEQIHTVSKNRLRKYLGTLTPEFMKTIQEKIDISLALDREVKTEVKTVVETKTEYIRVPVEPAAKPKNPEPRDLNMDQIKLLSYVDINKLVDISKSLYSDNQRVRIILELFGFNIGKNGVQYLEKAILCSPKNDYFNLESLVETISKDEDIEKEEIKRLIVARVKENFGFKKSPTIDFIRLINHFLKKEPEEELEDEKNDI